MITFSPAAKILLYIFFIISVFISNSLEIDLMLLALTFVFAVRVPISILKRGIIPILLFLAFTFFSNILFQTGRVIYEFWGIAVTEEALVRSSHLTLRLFMLIMGAKILTATTSAEEIITAVTVLLGPVGRWKPIKDFISTMSLTLRFLPIIYDEARNLYKEALKNSPEAAFTDKIRLSALLVTPLFERSMKRAKDLQTKGEGV
ncbi:MAG: energy-coupling factor transporter transmembrane component T [Nitrospirota bacterium]